MSDGIAKGPTNLEVDLVVIGGGGAGLPAAISARENGVSRIIVLEKRAVLGGNAARAWGIFAADSRVQKQALVEARSDDLFKTLINWSHWSINARMVRAFINKSADTVHWFEKKGIEFDLLRYFPGQEPPVWHVPKGKGAQLIKVLGENCKELGIQLLLQTQGKKILCSDEGNITGVIAEQAGEEFTINTKSVIIATGGYAGNPELLKQYCSYYDEHIQCIGLPHTGDGLLMGREIGASTEGLGLLHLEWPHVHGDPKAVLTTLAREPYAVYINKMGERFIDESQGLHAFVGATAVLRQPEKVGYILLDERMIQSIENNGVILGRGKDRTLFRRGMPGLQKELCNAAVTNNSRVKIAENWADLAGWIGAEPEVLESNINQYNNFCDTGYDQEFVKNPKYLVPLRTGPFYAIKAELIFLQTVGGLKVNDRMEVLNHQNMPIPGLFAAGVDIGGWEPDTYCDALSGAAFGFSVNSGRIAGENANDFVNKM